MPMRPNLVFEGYSEHVLTYYQAAFGGEAEITRFRAMPEQFKPPGWDDKILYARLFTPFGELDLMDAPPGREVSRKGNIAIAIDIDDDDLAANVFANLAADGTIIMPFEQAFFARKFGMTEDKYGIRWMISVAPTGTLTA